MRRDRSVRVISGGPMSGRGTPEVSFTQGTGGYFHEHSVVTLAPLNPGIEQITSPNRRQNRVVRPHGQPMPKPMGAFERLSAQRGVARQLFAETGNPGLVDLRLSEEVTLKHAMEASRCEVELALAQEGEVKISLFDRDPTDLMGQVVAA